MTGGGRKSRRAFRRLTVQVTRAGDRRSGSRKALRFSSLIRHELRVTALNPMPGKTPNHSIERNRPQAVLVGYLPGFAAVAALHAISMPQKMLRTSVLALLITATLIACSSLQTSDDIQTPNQLVVEHFPVYPRQSRDAGEEGKVFVSVLVGKSGDPIEVKVSKSSGFKALDDSAIAAVEKWKFPPITKKGQPVEARVEIPIVFKIKK